MFVLQLQVAVCNSSKSLFCGAVIVCAIQYITLTHSKLRIYAILPSPHLLELQNTDIEGFREGIIFVTHPCIYIILSLQGDCWICMELMDTSLDKFYKFICERMQTRIPENILAKITLATVKALNYLKEKLKIIHRYVSSVFCFLTTSKNLKLK